MVAEVCALGLTLWSLIIARHLWSQCVDGGCLNVLIDNRGTRSSFVKGFSAVLTNAAMFESVIALVA